MAHDPAFPRVIAPTQREHVTVGFGNDGLVPALFKTLLSDDQIAKADLLPIPRQIGQGSRQVPPIQQRQRPRSPERLMNVRFHSGRQRPACHRGRGE